MDLGLQSKTALVLGAGGGLGGAVARALAREGARVAVCDLDAAAAERSAQAIGAQGGTARPFMVDLAAPAQRSALVEAVVGTMGPVDVLVNNSGGPPATKTTGVASEDWSRHFEAMVNGLIDLTDRVLPEMRRRGWGRILTSTSSGVVTPIPNLAISNTLRLALVGWSKSLAAEVARDGVTVNVVAPGRIATGRVKALDEARAQREQRAVEDIECASKATIPLGRYGTVEEYADVVAFLASERASFVTGSVIRVDGGMIPSIF